VGAGGGRRPCEGSSRAWGDRWAGQPPPACLAGAAPLVVALWLAHEDVLRCRGQVGVDYAQGYAIGHPVSLASHLAALSRAGRRARQGAAAQYVTTAP
jgi:hypothetical protein